MPLPDFVIMGAMKSGTSTLHSNLQLHPEIGMSRFKEPSFFNERYLIKDLDWYKDQFRQEKRVNGESSPNYSKKHAYPGTAKRMYETLPEIKIIYLTRDPIERIISHLHHNLYRDRLKYEEIDEAVIKDENYVLTSSYYYQLQEYLQFYKKDQFLFLLTEDLKLNLNETLNKICKFLEVDNFDFRGKDISRNTSSQKYLIKNYDWAKAILSREQMKIYHWMYYIIGMKIKRPELKASTVKHLYKNLHGDMESYCAITGIDKSKWKMLNFIEDEINEGIETNNFYLNK